MSERHAPLAGGGDKMPPFLRSIGAQFVSAVGGKAEVALDVAKEHENSWGAAHGGIVMTLLDVAMARAGRSLLDGDGHDTPTGITVELKVSFFRPALGRLLARGRVVHRASTLMYCEAELVDAEGALLAKALGTFKFMRRGVAEAKRLR